MRIEVITKENADAFKNLMLTYIYDELMEIGDEIDTEFLSIAAILDETEEGYDMASSYSESCAASVLVIQPEATGDFNIVSIFTLPALRGRGFATILLEKAITILRQMFEWDDDDDEEEVVLLKTLYRLPDDIRLVYEEYLMKNHFTDFVQVESKEESSIDDGLPLDVWSAVCELSFIKNAG